MRRFFTTNSYHAEIRQGDVVFCPSCDKEFIMESFDDEELDDYDKFFEHVSMCNDGVEDE